jgi:dTDP-4-amino-4,6-dideoxygalactose transaminase
MKKAGITVSQVHARNDMHTMFKDFRTDLPGVDEFTSEQVSIPVGWWLTEKDMTHIINTILEYERSMRPRIQEVKKPPQKYEKKPAHRPNL